MSRKPPRDQMTSGPGGAHMFCGDYTQMCVLHFNQALHLGYPALQQKCYQMIEALKKDAERHIEQNRLNLAEQCYGLALNSLVDVKRKSNLDVLTVQDLAILWGNVSYVQFKQDKYKDAYTAAVNSMTIDPTYSKGYWRACQALKAMSNYTEAAQCLVRSLMISQPKGDDDFVMLMSELAILVTYLKSEEEWCAFEELDIMTTSALSVWARIIKKLSDSNEYDAVGILTIGMCSNGHVPRTVLHKMADIPGLNFSSFHVGKMLKFLRDKEGTKTWHLRLADFVVSRGALLMTIKDCFLQPLLVIMTTLSVEGEVPSFLGLAWDKVGPEDYDEVDSEGNTPAHALAKTPKFSTWTREVICRDLLAHGCLTSQRDKAGKLPHQYVPPTFSVHKWLSDVAEKPGSAIYDRLEQIRKQGNEALKCKQYARAIQLYQKGLAISTRYRELNQDTAVLYSNLAAVHLQTQAYGKAIEAADKSLQADGKFCKSYLRKGQAFARLGNYLEAAGSFTAGYLTTEEDQYRIKFAYEIALVLPFISDIDLTMHPLFYALKDILAPVWPNVLEQLTQNSDWASVNLLVLGRPSTADQVLRNAGGPTRGIMGGFDANTATLSTIFGAIDDKQVNAPGLVAALLQKGTSPASLATSEKDTHFHAAVRFCVLTRDTQVLEVILARDKTNQVHFVKDQEERTPLHTLCLECQKRNIPSFLSKRIASLLVEKGVDVKVKDKYQRQAVDYTIAGSELRAHIQELAAPKPKPGCGPKPATPNGTEGPKPGAAKGTERPKPASGTKSEGPKPSATKDKGDPWAKLKERGNQAFQMGDYTTAVQMYTEAIFSLEQEVKVRQISEGYLNETDGHNLAVLYGNRAECWYKQKEMKMFLEDAKKNVDYDGNWYKGHLRVGRAFREREKLQNAAKAFVNAYNLVKPSEGEVAKHSVLEELVETAFLLREDPEAFLKNLKDTSSETWALLSYDYVKKSRWDVAEFVFRNVDRPPSRQHDVDLGPFCKKELLDNQKWICSFLLWLLDSGADHKKLKFHKGDTYFHAIISIIVLTGSSPVILRNKYVDSDATQLLSYVMEKKVIPSKEKNIQDNKGNTVLHLLAMIQGPDRTRDFLARYLLEKGVDVMTENNEGKKAIDLVSNGDIIKNIIIEYMDKDIAIHTLKDQSKQRNDDRRNKPQEKKQSYPTGAKDATSKNAQPPRQPCDNCEKKLEEALLWQQKEKYHEAYDNLVAIINSRHNHDPRHKKFRETSIQRIATLLSYEVAPGIPASLVKINAEGCREVLDKLAETGKWRQIEILVTKFKQAKGQSTLPSFAKNMSLLELIRDESLTNMEAVRMDLINLLVSHGAKLDPKTSASALKEAVKNAEWQVVLKLLELRADSAGLTLTPGDTPLHAALQLALIIKPGNFTLLEKLKALYDTDKAAYPNLSPSSQDSDGNTLLHLAARGKFNHNSLRAVELLCRWGVPADLPNSEGKLPIQCLPSSTDRRAQYLKTSRPVTKVQSVPPSKSPRDAATSATPEAASRGARPKTSQQSQKDSYGSPFQYGSSVQASRDSAETTLLKFPDVSYNYLGYDDGIEEDAEDGEEEEEGEESEEEEDEDNEDEEDEIQEKKSEVGSVQDTAVWSDDDEEDGGEASSTEEISIDVKAFDNLAWDVECTEEVWNLLRTRKEKRPAKDNEGEEKEDRRLRKERIPDILKQVVVKKIQQLASGDWRPHLQRRIKGVPDSMQLFRIALPQGACILWELAVAFSPRRSETAENILASEEGEHSNSGSAVKGGRIYSELIRVWSIVLKHSELRRTVKKIVSSHRRGEDCIIQKNLKGLSNSQFATTSSSRFPVLYVESDLDPAVTKEIEQGFQRRLYPPASSRKSEFHILKFYSFSSSLVSAILNNIDTKIDFPFRVTDIEHAIINLDSKSPLLLLGRSGTGKTTCCLYRLWSMFLRYWEQATSSGAPLLPRNDYLPQLEGDNEGEEQEETERKGGVQSRAENKELSSGATEGKTNEFDFLEDSDKEVEEEDNEDNSDEEDNEEEDDSGIQYDHLHQLFVTKNPVQCSEVEKNFLKLQHAATDVMEKHNKSSEENLPNTLQDVDDFSFPLFLTSRQLLLMLDASVDGEPFFPRDEDLALKVTIPGWGTQEDIFNIIPLEHESDEEESMEEASGGKKVRRLHSLGTRPRLKADPRRECTYEVFAYEVWPKVAKKAQVDCHPSLVWTEIMSFIKGSYEALHSEKGYLDKTQYVDLGRKRAPNFSGDRSQVYDVFLGYNNYRQQHFLFDEADLVFRIYCRLRTMTYQPWVLHEIYVDETQDFTQAELALLVSLCQDPNKMFLTGDTAQSIMRGISFRFSDLRSLFHYAKESARINERYLSAIKVPQKVHQLTHNYRSHTGILSLASAVLDILLELFPESFDRLRKDQGMFDGPRPVVIESCSPGDLALLLTGNKRKTSHIEFGAHQAILVVSEEAKANLPEELSTGIVLTIYESKGLEFDDVLIYNFFKDSPAQKEWRVVTEFLEKMAHIDEKLVDSENLVEIDADVLAQPNRPRPLHFDASQHKVLNSELKHLYTALTRARVNVWIFDEDDEKRAPMFEYFKARRLVTSMGSEEDVSEGKMFTDKSSAKEWKHSGDNYMRQKLYTVAAKCYRKAEQHDKERLALAYQSALEASRIKTSPRAMRDAYLKAGAQFVQCGDLYRAALCFQNARDHSLAALAFEKNGQFEEASLQYIRAKKANDASRCLEQAGMFGRAINVLVDSEIFDRAIDCLHRYEMEVEKFHQEKRPVPAVLIENKPSDAHSEANLCYRSAEHHYHRGDRERAVAAIHRVRDTEMQIDFLQKRGFWKEAAEILKADGQTKEAAELMLKGGDIDTALKYAKDGFHKPLTAFIHLVLARKSENPDNFHLDLIKYNATKALDIYTELGDRDGGSRDGQAQAKLMLGKHTMDMKQIKEAITDFKRAKPPNQAGRLEAFDVFMTTTENLNSIGDCHDAADNITEVFKLIEVLLKPKTENRLLQLSCLNFFGLELDMTKQEVTWYPHQYPLCKNLLEISDTAEDKTSVTQDAAQVVSVLVKQYIERIKSWRKKVLKALDKLKSIMLPCKRYQEGRPCIPKCSCMHRPYESWKEESEALKLLNCSVLLDYYIQTGMDTLGENSDLQAELTSLKSELPNWNSVEEFLAFIIPTSPSALRSNAENTDKLVTRLRDLKSTVAHVERYFRYLWENPGRVGKGKSQNVMKERCKSTDWIVQACFFASLLKFKNLDVEKEVRSLEHELMNNEKTWFDKGWKYALFPPIRRGRDTLIEAMGSRFVESFKMLTQPKPDPYEAIFPFTKMITAFGNRGEQSLMPKLDHLVFWLEYYFCLTLFFVAQAKLSAKQKKHFYLTDHLLANLHLVNTCITSSNKGKAQTIQQLVVQQPFKQDLNTPGKLILIRQGSLVNFLVGHWKYSKFSLISLINKLCEEDSPSYSMVERILMLAVVVLLNIPGGFVFPEQEVPIRREFFKLHVTGTMPPRLVSLITALKNARNYQDVCVAATSFLRQQGSGTLHKCEWHGRYTSPMKWQELQPSEYICMDFYAVDLEKLVQESTEEVQRGATESRENVPADEEETEDWDKEVERMEAKKTAVDEENRKKEAVMKIMRALKLSVVRSRLRTKAYRNYELLEMFKPYRMKETSCGICGVEWEQMEAYHEVDEIGDGKDTKETHEKSTSHKEKLKEFETFRNLYESQIHSHLDEITRFLCKHKVEEDSMIYQDIKLQVTKVLKALEDFRRIFADIMAKREWLNRQNMIGSFQKLRSEFEDNRKSIEAQYKQFKKEEEEGQQEKAAEQEHEERMADGIVDVGLDPTDQPVTGRGQGQTHGQGQREGNRRDRGRGQRWEQGGQRWEQGRQRWEQGRGRARTWNRNREEFLKNLPPRLRKLANQ